MSSTPTNLELYTVRFESRPNYLYAFISGAQDSYEISHDYWVRTLKECKERGYNKVLIEEDLTGSIPTLDIYNLLSELPEIVSELGIRSLIVAFTDRQAEHHSDNLFGETVAMNRGMRGKTFCDFGQAEEWLLAQT